MLYWISVVFMVFGCIGFVLSVTSLVSWFIFAKYGKNPPPWAQSARMVALVAASAITILFVVRVLFNA